MRHDHTPLKSGIDAHVCENGTVRKYPSILCSMCRSGRSFDVQMSEDEIDRHNLMTTHYTNPSGASNAGAICSPWKERPMPATNLVVYTRRLSGDELGHDETLTVGQLKIFYGSIRWCPFEIKHKQSGAVYTVRGFNWNTSSTTSEAIFMVDGVGDVSIFDMMKEYEVVQPLPVLVNLAEFSAATYDAGLVSADGE